MKLSKSKKGISLIVLVITIIVMIILATAIILSLNSSNIVDKAKEAKTASDSANAKNVVALAKGEWELMTTTEQNAAGGFSAYATKKLQEAGYSVTSDGSFTVTDNGAINTRHVYTDANGNEKTVIIPEGFVMSSVASENTVENGLVIYAGTQAVTDSNVVEARETRNQFVWIPVDDIEEFKAVPEGYSEPLSTYCSTWDGSDCAETATLSLTNDLTGEWAEHKALCESVSKYGGFYIGRYETGTSTKTPSNVLVQKNKYVYNNVEWSNSTSNGDMHTNIDINGGAIKLARDLYDTNSIKSTLTYGSQWDAACSILDITNKGYVNEDEVEPILTGSVEEYCSNNIYDMAGNAHEWTMEFYDSHQLRVMRGGSLWSLSEYLNASERETWNSAMGYMNPDAYRI